MNNAPPSWLSRNTLLSALPASSLALLDAHIEPIECDLHRVLANAGEPMKFVFFPTGGCVSMIRRLVDGRAAEVGLVGREGMVGLPVLMGNDVSYVEALVQASGVMLRIPADTFRRACREDPSLQQHLLRYALVFQNLTTQSAVCNGNHPLEQRGGPLAAHDARPCRWRRVRHDAGLSGDDAGRPPPRREHHGAIVPADRTDQLWKRTPSGHRPTWSGSDCLRMLRRCPGGVSPTDFPTACVTLRRP